MMGSAMGDVEGRRIRQGRTKNSEDGLFYRKVFRGDEVVECSVCKELEPTAKKMVVPKAVIDRRTRYEKAGRKKLLSLRERGGYF